jgi:hypothetical protein
VRARSPGCLVNSRRRASHAREFFEPVSIQQRNFPVLLHNAFSLPLFENLIDALTRSTNELGQHFLRKAELNLGALRVCNAVGYRQH